MERLVYADNLSDKVLTHLYLQKKSGKQNKPGLRSFFVYPNNYIKYLGFFWPSKFKSMANAKYILS